MRLRTAWLWAWLCSVPLAVEAQPSGPGEQPSGPAELIKRAQEGRARSELERAGRTGDAVAGQAASAEKEKAPEGVPGSAASDAPPANEPSEDRSAPANPQAAGAPSAGVTAGSDGEAAHHAADPHAVLEPPAMASAEPSADLPSGSIAIEVLDPRGQPYPNAEIVLGIMGGMGNRSEERAKSGIDGRYRFDGLAAGSKQAYRVNVLYGGAKFSSTPFRLPEDTGYRVRIPLRTTTTDQRMVFQVIGQTVVELRDDRLHVTQQARLANAGQSVFVLPKDGLVIPLPEGFTAFSWQDQMTDQRGEEVAGKGFRMRGSLPPGTVTLAWSYDLPREGSAARIPVEFPFRTFTYRLISEAPPGLSLRASEFPEPERVKDQGRDLLFTQIQRGPQEAPLGAFTIKIDGIPGPGPGRWFAVGLAVLVAFWGLLRAVKPVEDTEERRALLAERKRVLLARAKETEEEHARGDIGPEFKAKRMDELVTELALLLRDEEALPRVSKR